MQKEYVRITYIYWTGAEVLIGVGEGGGGLPKIWRANFQC